jgi:hypothetical protein
MKLILLPSPTGPPRLVKAKFVLDVKEAKRSQTSFKIALYFYRNHFNKIIEFGELTAQRVLQDALRPNTISPLTRKLGEQR